MEKFKFDATRFDEMIKKAKEQQAKNKAQSAKKPAGNINLPGLFSGRMDNIVIRSSTPGSDKKFKITVDDTGAISAMEVAE